MDDATAWLPEAYTILGTDGGQEVIHLLVQVLVHGRCTV